MANRNPSKARQAKAAKRRAAAEEAGTVADLRDKLWRAMAAADDVLGDDAADAALKLRALHATVQASGAYLKVLEVVDLEARMAALEARLAERTVF